MMRNTNKVTFLAFATSHPIMAFMVVNTICKTIKAVPSLVKEAAQAIKEVQTKGAELVNDGTFKKFLEDIDEVATSKATVDIHQEDEEAVVDINETETEETTEAPASEEEEEYLLS